MKLVIMDIDTDHPPIAYKPYTLWLKHFSKQNISLYSSHKSFKACKVSGLFEICSRLIFLLVFTSAGEYTNFFWWGTR